MGGWLVVGTEYFVLYCIFGVSMIIDWEKKKIIASLLRAMLPVPGLA